MREDDHQQGPTSNAGLFMIQRNVDSGMVPLPMFSCLSRWLSKGVFESLMCMPYTHVGLEWTVRFVRGFCREASSSRTVADLEVFQPNDFINLLECDLAGLVGPQVHACCQLTSFPPSPKQRR